MPIVESCIPNTIIKLNVFSYSMFVFHWHYVLMISEIELDDVIFTIEA